MSIHMPSWTMHLPDHSCEIYICHRCSIVTVWTHFHGGFLNKCLIRGCHFLWNEEGSPRAWRCSFFNNKRHYDTFGSIPINNRTILYINSINNQADYALSNLQGYTSSFTYLLFLHVTIYSFIAHAKVIKLANDNTTKY